MNYDRVLERDIRERYPFGGTLDRSNGGVALSPGRTHDVVLARALRDLDE